MSALAKAIRDEMFEVLNAGELTPAACSELMRLAEHGRELLRAKSKKPEDFAEGTLHIGDNEVPALNTETFGVKILKELMPMLKHLQGGTKPEDPEQLVRALATARAEGLADVAKMLEEKLGLKQPEMALTLTSAVELAVPPPSGGPMTGTIRATNLQVVLDPPYTEHSREEGEVPPA